MKRFYREVTVGPQGDGWQVLLDGRGIKTAGGAPQVLPGRALTEAMAAEWAGQGEQIAPKAFVLRDLADYVIDVVKPGREATIAELLPYAETDTLCYRAEPDAPILVRQDAVWEPLLRAAEARWAVQFTRVSGVIHCSQPPATVARLAAELSTRSDFDLAALKMLASLSASLVIGLAALDPDADADALWNAANLEEDWQAELWGKDAEALEHRALRFAAFKTAMRFAALARAE